MEGLLAPPLKVDDEEDDPQQNTDGPNHEVGDTQEWILAAQPGRRRQNHTLGPIKGSHWIGCRDK